VKLAWPLLLLTSMGCGGSSNERGDWTITAFRMPGYSALTRAEAQQFVGRTIHLGSPAVSGEERCALPRFTQRRVPAERFMLEEYHLTAGHIGLFVRDSIDVLEVDCDGSRWSALGGRVLFVADDRGYAPWDGIFFTIEPVGRE
jgi:hypothetical protein